MVARSSRTAPQRPSEILDKFQRVRKASRALAAPLSDADATVQSMPDASPAKWHLAHTTWFFETMVLSSVPTYRRFDDDFSFLFNSYYETLGKRQPRPRRGMITRPTLETVLRYREHVDAAVYALLETSHDLAVSELVELGCHHEQQHQELLLTDILHLFAQNPLQPPYKDPEPLAVDPNAETEQGWHDVAGGLVEIGHDGNGFSFDSEGPRHRVFTEPFALADRPVTNGEWIAFIEDGGYRNPLLWLSDGWHAVQANDWWAPLYWQKRDNNYWTMTLRGPQPVDRAAPVAHVSYFEADAYAAWAGHRLPTEAEWEVVAVQCPVDGNFAATGRLRPRPAGPSTNLPRQMFGDVWEWTRSPFAPYPGFRAESGAVGEYNGKFMCGQFVLRGGSCVTPDEHMRATYRNFFPPHARWQFSGLRLAKDL
ncbi:MAG: ergothioneine biosynthesis protein EgtB [Pseudomonadota bacterium]